MAEEQLRGELATPIKGQSSGANWTGASWQHWHEQPEHLEHLR